MTAKSNPKPPMSLARCIVANTSRIISDWEHFARSCLPAAVAMDLTERRDHIEGMLKAIATDLDSPQTKLEQSEKAKGNDDAPVNSSNTHASAHGTDRAAIGYTLVQMVSEFRALRASILNVWSETHQLGGETEYRANLKELTRFNEAIDQLLAESTGRYAQEVERSKDVFLGVVGHDLRNPLGAIMMSASVMLSDEGPDWSHARATSRIINSCTRMERIISDLMDVTRARLGGGILIVRAAMDLEATCRLTTEELSAFHPKCVIDFKAAGALEGSWDSGRIAQLLSNLVGNAYEHGTEGAPIEVAVLGEADHVVLSVHNQGNVIPKKELENIFNPFQQLPPAPGKARAKGSVGLGLYIAQAIVTAHLGTIGVQSTKRGTTFTVRLPRAEALQA